MNRKWLCAGIALAFGSSVAANDYCFSGSYYNAARDCEGVNVEQIAEDAAVAYFYTYREGEEEFYVSVLNPLEDDPLAWFGPVTDTEYDGEFPVTGLDAIAGELLLEFKTEEVMDGETVLGMEVVGFDAYLDLEQDLKNGGPCTGSFAGDDRMTDYCGLFSDMQRLTTPYRCSRLTSGN